jgi:hypothetical protein
MKKIEADLNASVQIYTNRRNATTQIEITRWAMTDTRFPLCDEFHFGLFQMNGMPEYSVRAQKPIGIIHASVVGRLGKKLLDEGNLGLVLGDVRLDVEGGIRRGEVT